MKIKMRYIPKEDVIGLLNVSRSVEQLLAKQMARDSAIRFIRIDKETSGIFSTALFEVSDDGNPDFLDIYEFSAIDPDLPCGDIRSFQSAEDALKYACQSLGATEDKFVGAGMIQDEYMETIHPEWKA